MKRLTIAAFGCMLVGSLYLNAAQWAAAGLPQVEVYHSDVCRDAMAQPDYATNVQHSWAIDVGLVVSNPPRVVERGFIYQGVNGKWSGHPLKLLALLAWYDFPVNDGQGIGSLGWRVLLAWPLLPKQS